MPLPYSFRALEVMAMMSLFPGASSLTKEDDRVWVSTPISSKVARRVEQSVYERLLFLGFVRPTRDDGSAFTLTDKGLQTLNADLTDRLRKAWSSQVDMGMGSHVYPSRVGHATAASTREADLFKTLGWIEILPGREPMRFSYGAMEVLGISLPKLSVEERYHRRQAEIQERCDARDAREDAKLARTEAEAGVVRMARALFREDATLEDLKEAVGRLESLLPDDRPEATVSPSRSGSRPR